MEPMPKLVEPALPEYQPRPTWSQRHPRAASGLNLLFALVFVAVSTNNLRRDGFDWFSIVLLIITSGAAGVRLVELVQPDPGTPSSAATAAAGPAASEPDSLPPRPS